ncbi:glycosyltransferase [Candidatus Falkowbacteria bacterium]|nr:glycosyltransferase [Candidatus Falkowbacteria bacterium]
MNKFQPEITILIPVRNVAKYIRGCLDALLAQDYPKEKIKIWILDNSSSDGTPGIVAEYKNRGVDIFQMGVDPPAKKYNLIWPKIETEFIGLVDGDAYVSRDWLKNVIAPLAEEGVAGASGLIKTENPEKLFAKLVGYDWQDRCERSTKNVKRVPCMHTVYKKKAIDEIGGFNELLKTGYDVDLGYRLTKAGHKIRYVPEAVTYHCHRDNFISWWKQQYEYAKFALKRYLMIPENVLGDSFAPWWVILQPAYYALVLALFALSMVFGWPWWLFLVPMSFLFILYIFQSARIAVRYSDPFGFFVIILYIVRPIIWSIGAFVMVVIIIRNLARNRAD